MKPRRRPGRLWLLFFGKQRRGFPQLLALVLGTLTVLALSYGVPHAADFERYAGLASIAAIALLAVGALLAALVAVARGGRGRRRR